MAERMSITITACGKVLMGTGDPAADAERVLSLVPTPDDLTVDVRRAKAGVTMPPRYMGDLVEAIFALKPVEEPETTKPGG